MKIQNLSIIFLVIIIPLIMILSYYLNLQQDTLKLQAEYDTKLAEATKQGIKAFEVNTVDWSAWESDKTSETERNDARAAVNAFITSLANNLNISGTAKEFMVNYIPAVAATMYDGYYIYSPNYLPISIENDNGLQLYYDAEEDIITESDGYGNNLPIYMPKSDATSKDEAKYTYKDDDDNEKEKWITFVTDINDAETEYKHILSNQIAYTEKYSKGTDTNVVVNYTLDNRIYVYGIVDGTSIEKDGYLVYFDDESALPRIKLPENAQDDTDIDVSKKVQSIIYSDGEISTQVDAEILEEQILYLEDSQYKLGTFKYVYNIEHEKLYYDETEEQFFKYNEEKKVKDYVLDDNSVTSGSDLCEYKSVSVLLEDDNITEYKKIYQVLNGQDKGKWYISVKEDSTNTNSVREKLDTEIGDNKVKELGLNTSTQTNEICKDYSAINYYVESYAFTNWARENLSGVKIYNKDTGNYENIIVEGVSADIFNITNTNNPEKEISPIVIHKKEIMKKDITTNLNLAISNYSMGTYEFKLPELTDSDWEQVFSNISMISFFQGIPIGLKHYNNYAIATSTTNREYVDPGEIYFSGDDENYHRVYCSKCKNEEYTGYRSVEYILKEQLTDAGNMYYYQHDTQTDQNSETACYYCLVNRANYQVITDEMEDATEIKYKQAKAYNEALARERYYQKVDVIQEIESTPQSHVATLCQGSTTIPCDVGNWVNGYGCYCPGTWIYYSTHHNNVIDYGCNVGYCNGVMNTVTYRCSASETDFTSRYECSVCENGKLPDSYWAAPHSCHKCQGDGILGQNSYCPEHEMSEAHYVCDTHGWVGSDQNCPYT